MNRRASGFHLERQRRWLVLFFDPIQRLRGWDVFNTPGFRHCCLMAYLPIPQLWVHLDYGADGTSLCILEGPAADLLIARIMRNGGTILEWEVPETKPVQPLLYPPNCVAYCQQFLGLAETHWTPYGLALCLAGKGARPMFGSSKPLHRSYYVRRFRTPGRPGAHADPGGGAGHQAGR